MKDNYTHISVILDRTGSMASIRDDTIGGFNAFLAEQQAESGKATLTLVQFDSQDPYEVIHRFEPIHDIPPLTQARYVPRAMTPLLDALGRGMLDLEQQIAQLPAEARPERVILVIITDGYENASREFDWAQIKQMMREKQEASDWQFVYLSADLMGLEAAISHGFDRDAVMAFDKNKRGAGDAWDATAKRIRDIRVARARRFAYHEEDRNKQQSERRRRKR